MAASLHKAAESSMSLNSKITIFVILILLLLFLTFMLPVTARAYDQGGENNRIRGARQHDPEVGNGMSSLGIGIDAHQI